MAYFQETDYALLSALLSRLPDRTVLDVGAEKGSFVELCLSAGSTRIFAFEPYPAHVETLRKKFADVAGVTVLDVAIGAADESLPFHIARDAAGEPLDYHHSLIRFVDTREVRWPSAIEVGCRSLDSLAAGGSIPRAVGLLKIDTEGGDLLVLHGAASIESAIVMVECWTGLPDSIRDSPYEAAEVVALLRGRGYRDFVFVKRQDEFESLQVGSARTRKGDWGNLIFVHQSVSDDLAPLLFDASAAAGDRLIDRALTFRQECQKRMAVIDTLQRALIGSDQSLAVAAPPTESHASAEPWVTPAPAGEAGRLRAPAPRVSVITPSYNQARFLEQAMRSVLEQGYANLEYIVIDGGSSDGSVEIIRTYASQLAFWSTEPDRGQANAVNKGMAHVTGDIVGWLNSDDFFYPGAIRAAVDAFASDPTLGFVYGQGNRVDERAQLIEPFAFTRPFDLDALTRGIDYILQPTVFMRRGALAQVGPLDATLRWTLDWDLWIRLGRKFPARMIDHLIAASREYATTKSSTGGLRRIDEIQQFVRRHTGRDVSIGYLNYLMFALLEALPTANLPLERRIEGGLHEVVAACGEVLRDDGMQQQAPSLGRRIVRAIVPPRVRRAILKFFGRKLP
jgi:FkbM family methyltransferase